MKPDVLSQLNDIVVPNAVGWWPPSQTLVGLIVGLGGILIGISWYLWKQRRLNRYRSQAMGLLNTALAQAQTPHQKIQITNQLLKQVAITHYGRSQVAALNGQAWVDFLKKTALYIDQPAALVTFVSAHYQPDSQLSESDLTACLDYAAKWIKGHHK